MKKLLLISLSFSLFSFFASAQCTPDPQYTEGGVYPNQATGFSSGCANQYYEQLVTVVVPLDTCVVIIEGWPCINVEYDSVVITSFTGLPSGLSYACNDPQNTVSPANGCAFEGNTKGCVLISGTTSQVGTFNLTITVDAYLGGDPSPQATEVIDYYSILIENCPQADLANVNKGQYKMYPNPSTGKLQIEGLEEVNTITLYDALGAIVKRINVHAVNELNMDLSAIKKGLYFVEFKSISGKKTERLILE